MIKIPRTDSIAELAEFWDTHDVTEFEDELEEVTEPVFERPEETVIEIHLRREQAASLHRVASSRGMDDAKLIEEWIRKSLEAMSSHT